MATPAGRVRPRRALVAQMRSRLLARGYPRLVVLLILGIAGFTAFGFSAWTLSAGFDEMGLRYLASTIVGYVTFLLLIRAWIALHRVRDSGGRVGDLGGLDGLSLPGGGSPSSHVDAGFAGGRSGGGGASGNWGSSSDGLPSVDLDLDAPEEAVLVIPVILAAACLLGGVIAMFYVVNAAPILLAEVALDAALVTGIYRKLRKEDARYWLRSALQHTWMPAAAAALCLWITGTALQWAMPAARSIGDVVRALGN